MVKLIVLCVINVGSYSYDFPGIPIIHKAAVRGTVLNQTENEYIVDFSKSIKEQRFVKPDAYHQTVVPKSDCVQVK